MLLQAFQFALLIVLLTIVGVLCVSVVQLWVELKAMKASTHTLTYIDPLTQQFGKKPDQATTEAMDDDGFGNIAMGGTEE